MSKINNIAKATKVIIDDFNKVKEAELAFQKLHPIVGGVKLAGEVVGAAGTLVGTAAVVKAKVEKAIEEKDELKKVPEKRKELINKLKEKRPGKKNSEEDK